jgi:tetratricopeptide (TPR) repeat protein
VTNLGILLSNVSLAAVQQGDYDGAEPPLQEALAIARSLADRHGESAAIFGLASIANYRERYDEAEAALIDSLQMLQEGAEAHRFPETFGQLAISAAGRGELERAARLLGATTAENERIGAAPAVIDRARWDAVLERARAELGDVADRAYADGRRLSRDEAKAYACRLDRPEP